MKYKTLVMKQIDQHTYQYSMNVPLDNLSSILSFDEEILKVNFGNELEYTLNLYLIFFHQEYYIQMSHAFWGMAWL